MLGLLHNRLLGVSKAGGEADAGRSPKIKFSLVWPALGSCSKGSCEFHSMQQICKEHSWALWGRGSWSRTESVVQGLGWAAGVGVTEASRRGLKLVLLLSGLDLLCWLPGLLASGWLLAVEGTYCPPVGLGSHQSAVLI